MAIAFDSETENVAGTADSLTYSHTCTGTNLVLIVGVGANRSDNTDGVTSVTYNGIAMTRLNAVNRISGNTWEYLYGLVGPATGANNVVVTANAGTTLWSHAVSYTGVSQTGLPDAQTTNTAASGTSITTNLTTVADNAWLVGYVRNFAANVTGGTNFTVRSTAFPIVIGDSNAALTPAGSKSMTANSSNSDWTVNLVSIAPAGAVSAVAAVPPTLLFMGVG